MIKILFSANNLFPSSNVGGSNKIIFEILSNVNYEKFQPYYLSYDFKKIFNGSCDLLQDLNSEIFTQRKIGRYLYKTNKLYRLLVTSKPYFYFHDIKRSYYYKNKFNRFPKFDIIHSHDVAAHSYFSKYREASKILTIHSKGSILSELNSMNQIPAHIIKAEKIKEKTALENSDIVIFPSFSARNLFIEDYHKLGYDVRFRNSEIIYNGINLEKIKSINYSEKDFKELLINKEKYDLLILNIAQHVPEKNIEKLLYSIAYIKHNIKKEVLFINVGDGPLTEELKKLISKLGIEKNVNLLGALPNQKVIQLMKRVDIFIMASKRVIFDMVVLEALAAGVCTLVSKDGGNTEIIVDSENGYFIESLEPDYIAKRIISIDTKRTIDNGLKTASNFSSSSMTQKYEQIYLDIKNMS